MPPPVPTVLLINARGPVGVATVRALAEGGCRVIVHAGGRGKVAVPASPAPRGDRVRELVADTRSVTAAVRFADRVWQLAGRLDAAVIFPAPRARGGARDPSLAQWQAAVDGGVKVPFFLARQIGLRMAAAGAGRLVFVAGAGGARAGAPERVVAEGLLALSDALSRALPRAVAVAAVVPPRSGAASEARAVADAVRGLIVARTLATGSVVRLGGASAPSRARG